MFEGGKWKQPISSYWSLGLDSRDCSRRISFYALSVFALLEPVTQESQHDEATRHSKRASASRTQWFPPLRRMISIMLSLFKACQRPHTQFVRQNAYHACALHDLQVSIELGHAQRLCRCLVARSPRTVSRQQANLLVVEQVGAFAEGFRPASDQIDNFHAACMPSCEHMPSEVRLWVGGPLRCSTSWRCWYCSCSVLMIPPVSPETYLAMNTSKHERESKSSVSAKQAAGLSRLSSAQRLVHQPWGKLWDRVTQSTFHECCGPC